MDRTSRRGRPRRRIVAAGEPRPRPAELPEADQRAELERACSAGWLALHEPLGEWTLRAAGGFTGRANSCLAVGDPGMPIAQAAERIVAFAERHGIAADGSGGHRLGRGRGASDTGLGRRLRTDRCAGRPAGRPARRQAAGAGGVRVVEHLHQPWWDAYQRSRPNTADPTLLRMILDGHPPRAFASAGRRWRGRAVRDCPRPPQRRLARCRLDLDP